MKYSPKQLCRATVEKSPKATELLFDEMEWTTTLGASSSAILKVYLTTIRPILEHAVPVWQNIPECLSHKLESIQKRALHIIFPFNNYEEALFLAQLTTLAERRSQLCKSYISNLKRNHHPINFLLPRPITSVNRYNLRSGPVSHNVLLYGDKKICLTKRSGEFVTFRYL